MQFSSLGTDKKPMTSSPPSPSFKGFIGFPDQRKKPPDGNDSVLLSVQLHPHPPTCLVFALPDGHRHHSHNSDNEDPYRACAQSRKQFILESNLEAIPYNHPCRERLLLPHFTEEGKWTAWDHPASKCGSQGSDPQSGPRSALSHPDPYSDRVWHEAEPQSIFTKWRNKWLL